MKRSMVYLVGAGPGDPRLITVKGLECIKKADVIIYDYLVNASLLTHARPVAEFIYVGKQGGTHTLEQEEINELLVKKAREDKIVTRLKGGDPYVFGRGGEEALVLRENDIPFEVVPGITAAIATLTFYMGIKNLPYITEQLMKHGRSKDTPVAVIRWGTTSQQKTVVGTLDTIVQKAKDIKPPPT